MDCKSTQTLEVSQGAGERQDYAFRLEQYLGRLWDSRPHAAGVAVRPRARKSTGLEYVSSGGVSGAEEPFWPKEDGKTVQDGTTTWTAQPISFASLAARIQSVVWSADGIFATDQVEIDAPALQEARITIHGGSTGQVHKVTGLVTDTLGFIHEVILMVTVT